MFSSVSHEFRTPLNAFINSLLLIENNYNSLIKKLDIAEINDLKELLPSKKVNETNEKHFKIWKISSAHLLSLVEDILDLAKIEAGTFTLNEKPFTIRKLVEEISYIFEFQWIQKNIFFKIEIDENLLNSSFNSDMGRIKQILINLISNSFKFTCQGGITLRINKISKFDEFSFNRSNFLKIKVIDTGIGIAKEDIPHLFKMFCMVDKHRASLNFKGTGLGLSISK